MSYQRNTFENQSHEGEVLLVITERSNLDTDRILGKGLCLEIANYFKSGKKEAYFADVSDYPHIPGMFKIEGVDITCEKIDPSNIVVINGTDYVNHAIYRRSKDYEACSLSDIFKEKTQEKRFNYGEIIL